MAATSAEWVERMRDASVLAVAGEFGRAVSPPRSSSGGSVYGCPACGAERRHTKTGDKRGAVGVTQSGAGWECFQCTAKGDAIDFVACALRSKPFRELGDAGKVDVREWCQRWLGLDGASQGVRPPRPITQPRPMPPREPPKYPPEQELAALWSACVRADSDDEAVRYLLGRLDAAGRPAPIDPVTVSDLDLARVVPAGLELPASARFRGQSWHETGHRLIVPMFDASGCGRSLLARRVRDGETPKTLPLAGYQRSELVMANALGRVLLATGTLPEEWPQGAQLRVYVCEGDTDFLLSAVGPAPLVRWADAAESAPAVLGIESGAWTQEIADRLPDRSVVVIATDDDKQGERYAAEVLKTVGPRYVAGRIGVERWRPKT